MRYVMKQKLFSPGGKFHVRNEHGQDVFLVEEAAFSFGRQLTFRDTAGGEPAFGVDVADGEDDVLILASTIVIDMVRAGSNR